jgi:DNA repair exonuclease SbcCD nuclease subunit
MIQLTQIINMQIKGTEVGIFSDPHYGVHRNSEIWHKIALDHAIWAAEQFKQRGIKDIIIPGDIFHDRNDIAVNTLHVATDIFDVLRDFNIIITVGNHDAYYRDNSTVNSVSILRGWSNITVVDTLTVETLQGKKIAFCPWGQDINEVPKCDLIVGHFEVNSFKMNSFKVCTNGLKASDLTDRAPLTITGHFHHREERKYKDGTILYVGAPYQQDWGDYGTNKGLYILDLTDLSYTFIENTISPRYNKIRYSDIANGTYTAESLRGFIRNNIVKFYIDTHLKPDVVDTIVRKLVSIKPVEFTIEYDYTESSKLNIEEANTKDFNISIENSISEFIDILDINHKEKVKNYVTDVYHRALTIT